MFSFNYLSESEFTILRINNLDLWKLNILVSKYTYLARAAIVFSVKIAISSKRVKPTTAITI